MATMAMTVLLALALAIPAVAQSPHPRIFITPDDAPRLAAIAADGETNSLGFAPAEAWATIRAQADTFANAEPYHYSVNMPGTNGSPAELWEYTLSDAPPPPHDDYSHYPPWTAMFQERSDSISTRLKYLLLAYKVSGDPLYFTEAKDMVLHLCAWPAIWTDPSYGGGKPCLDTGHATTWVAIFYDWCHDDLTAEERTLVRDALIEKGILPIDGMIDGIAPYHNYTAVIASGLCIGAIALVGEDDRAQGWIDHAVARAKLNFDAQGRDGGAMEGPMYGDYAANSFADMLWALGSAGIETDLLAHKYIGSLPRYCISLLNTNNYQQPCFGDGGPGMGFGRLMLTLALRGDREAAWFCEKGGAFAPDSPRGLLALDPAKLQPKQPEWNPSDAFVDVGYAILRDGYESGSAFLAFKSGPPESRIGHNHFDHNSFVINYAGEWCAWDPGYRSYFDPAARKYTTSSLGHNTVVLDFGDEYLEDMNYAIPGHDQQHVNKGRIAEYFTSDAYDYVMGQAAEAYNTDDLIALDRFDRRIVFIKPGLFLIHDDIAAPDEHTYASLLHLSSGGMFDIDGDSIRGLSSGCYIQARTFSPDGVSLAADTFPGAESYGPYLAASTVTPARSTSFTTVLVPRIDGTILRNPGFERGMGGWTPRRVEGVFENHVIDEAVAHSGDASARIDNSGYYYTRRFSAEPGTALDVAFWARCTAAEGASSTLHYWRDGKSFANTAGPTADANEWTRYEFTAVVPDGTEEVSLALQFHGTGQCWYDDVELSTDTVIERSEPATITPIGEDGSAIVVELDGVTHVLLTGAPGAPRTVEAAGLAVATDARLAVVSLNGDGPTGFIVDGARLTVDGESVPIAAGEWRVEAP